jgi:hypothetical protein
VSWAVHARRVRDEGLPLTQRVSALRSLVASHHAPLGFLGTVAHLRAATGGGRRGWTAEQLPAALAMLEQSRASHLAYRTAFAERRCTEKQQGRRRPTAGDVVALARAEWLKDVEEASRRVPSRRDRRRERGVG